MPRIIENNKIKKLVKDYINLKYKKEIIIKNDCTYISRKIVFEIEVIFNIKRKDFLQLFNTKYFLVYNQTNFYFHNSNLDLILEGDKISFATNYYHYYFYIEKRFFTEEMHYIINNYVNETNR